MLHGWVLDLFGLFGGQARAVQAARERESGRGNDEHQPWVCALTVYNPAQAQIALARLHDQAIPARLRQESGGSVLPMTVGLFGMIDVLVPEILLDQAQEVLNETLEIGPSDESAPD